MKKYDYIIVGQGLAGTCLAMRLLDEGQSFMIIDANHQSAASNVAAGIINPVTGRRLVKSWMIDDLLPSAKQFYQNLEKRLDTQFLYPTNIKRALLDHGDENQWAVKLGYEEYHDYLSEISSRAIEGVIPTQSIGSIKNALRVDLPCLIKKARGFFEKLGSVRTETFDHDVLVITEESVQYKDIEAQYIIFTEGHQITNNPFFDFIPMVLAKGEVLLLKAPELALAQDMYKRKLTYVPLGDQVFWVGATYEWKYEDDAPTEKGKMELLQKIEQDIDTPYRVIAHQAAIRPTIKDRRPVLGTSPKYKNVHVFNGLGTKGTSIAPYWSAIMKDYLLKGTDIDKEVSLERFIGSTKV